VNAQRGRDGRIAYHYFRRRGRRWRLPPLGDPPSEEFMAEYRRLLAETEPRAGELLLSDRSYVRGSFGALVRDYLASGGYKEKKARTQAEYRRVLELLSKRHGDKPVKRLERRHVRQMRDERADTPGAANTILRMMKVVLNFAVEDGLIFANPAAKMKELRVGEWRAWTDEECQAFEKRWAPATMQRRAYALAVYTGQRKSDVVRMTREQRSNGHIHVVQQKTDEELWIPEHRELTAELARGVAGVKYLLTTTLGKPFDPVYFGAWFADAIDAAALPDECVFHGLRKCAARKLAEAGCSEGEIASITGHRTSRMISKYTPDANRRKGAASAIRKWERNAT
jgi:integrase